VARSGRILPAWPSRFVPATGGQLGDAALGDLGLRLGLDGERPEVELLGRLLLQRGDQRFALGLEAVQADNAAYPDSRCHGESLNAAAVRHPVFGEALNDCTRIT
jgi:Arc/MetJ family transcription regulator